MSSIWGVTMVKNEEDIIGYTLQHMEAEGLAGLVVANNLSTDHTPEVIHTFIASAQIPVIYVEDKDPGHDQSRKMTALAAMAAEKGAEWIVPFDADELWSGLTGSLATVLSRVPNHVTAAAVATWTHVETGHDVDDDNPYKRMIWKRPAASSLPKACYRYSPDLTIWHGNDGITDKNGRFLELRPVDCEIRHLPIRSPDQFTTKVVAGAQALRTAQVPPNIGSHWRSYARVVDRYGIDALRCIYFNHLFFAEPQLHGFVKDPAPWRRGK